MKGYSRAKEDFREKIILKYKKYLMKEAIYIEGLDCSKCHMMKPHAEKRAEKSWYEFQAFRFDDASVSEFNVESVPMLILKEDWVVTQVLNMDWIVNLISNQNNNG